MCRFARLSIIWVMAGLIVDTSVGKPPAKAVPAASGTHALLIGVSKYDHLGEDARLRGPANDTKLMRDLLLEYFKTPKQNVVVLAEHVGKKSHRPLRANIEREFKALAKRVKRGDQVVVYLTGHGSQQPDDDPGNPADYEPDGMDEIFLPADAKEVDLTGIDLKKLDPSKLRVPNAVVDDDFRKWIDAIRSRGASVWAILDSCHSGSAVRGAEAARQWPPERLIPKEALAAAASAKRGGEEEPSPLDTGTRSVDQPKNRGGLVAIYAAQPYEATFELPLLRKTKSGKPKDSDFCGLLTYTMVKVLRASDSKITYTELVQHIHTAYITTFGRIGPTPLVEGGDRHKEVLGRTQWEDRSRIIMRPTPDGRIEIGAGLLQGLTEGSILAIYPPPGAKSGDKRLGHVKITKLGTVRSLAERCEYDGMPKPKLLHVGGRCELVHFDYGDLRLKVAIDGSAKSASDKPNWRRQLRELAAKKETVFTLVDDPQDAAWLVRPRKRDLVLVPAAGWPQSPGGKKPLFGPVPADDKAAAWLEKRLGRIARATTLLKVSGKALGKGNWLANVLFGKRQTDVRAELLRLKDEKDRKGTPIKWAKGGMRLRVGDLAALRITNSGTQAIDFTLLFIDSGYGIQTLFPPPDRVADNRLEPGRSFTVGPMQVEGDSLGLEHIVVIALKSRGQPVDFGWLAQDSIEQVRATAKTRSGRHNLDNPLAKLLQRSLYRTGGTRGIATADFRHVSLKHVSWYTTPKN